MTSFIPHEINIFDNREPPWISNKVKKVIQEKKKLSALYEKIVTCLQANLKRCKA